MSIHDPILREIEDGLCLKDEEATHEAGLRIGRIIRPGSVVGLDGNLGSGKTTLARGIAEGWGVSNPIKSPTFNYYLLHRGDRGLLAHLDAYRIDKLEDYDSLMLEDFLEEPWLLLVEWAEKIAERLPNDTLRLSMASTKDRGRRLSEKRSLPAPENSES